VSVHLLLKVAHSAGTVFFRVVCTKYRKYKLACDLLTLLLDLNATKIYEQY
jgi:hypothetical protein